jgi:hypothetical protein
MRKLLIVIAVVMLSVGIPGTALAHGRGSSSDHVQARLHAVGDSGVSGLVELRQVPREDGTRITVVAFGLHADQQYVSLYYDNAVCELEPYSADDVIGGIYTANRAGVGTTQGQADDDLDEIHSVSVRQASDFKLLACANVTN